MAIESVVFYAKNNDILFINAAIGLEMCDFFNGLGNQISSMNIYKNPHLSSPPRQPFSFFLLNFSHCDKGLVPAVSSG